MNNSEAFKLGEALGTLRALSFAIWSFIDKADGDYSWMGEEYDLAIETISKHIMGGDDGSEPVHPS